MKIVLVSNFLNMHMLPICSAFCKNEKIETFTFVALHPQSNERKELGFIDINKQYSFVLCAYDNSSAYEKALELTMDADVAIIADAPNDFVHARMKNNKLTFLCSERFYKKGLWRRFNPRTYSSIYNRVLKYKSRNLYFLTIGAYMPYDLHLLGFPIEKCFQWAYFPEINYMERKRTAEQKIKILWVGRFLNVKHPEAAVTIAGKLKKQGLAFELNMIGNGEEFEKIRNMVKTENLTDVLTLMGVCSPDKVQNYMEDSDIFLFTSDYWEGWGAVLSEAMGQQCVPIASMRAGASQILIQDGDNGFIYKSIDQAVKKIIEISNNNELRMTMSIKAQKTIMDRWSPETAALRFIEVTQALLNNKPVPDYDTTEPMSKASLKKAGNYIYTNR